MTWGAIGSLASPSTCTTKGTGGTTKGTGGTTKSSPKLVVVLTQDLLSAGIKLELSAVAG